MRRPESASHARAFLGRRSRCRAGAGAGEGRA